METKYFAIAAFMLSLAACSNDESTVETINDSQPVVAQFIGCIDKIQSRADGVIWDADDAIGISGGEYTNIKYLADTKGSDRHFTAEMEGDEIYFKEKKTVNFIAYHPYTGFKGAPGGIITKTITASDQEGTAQQQIDFMFGKGSGNRNAASVELNLQHKMSLVTLNFKSGGDDISKLTSYSINNVKMSGQFDTADGTVELMEGGTNLTMNPTGISGRSYSKSLILYPQKLNAPIPIEAMWDGQLISGELKIDENDFKPNSQYICDVTVSKDGLEVNAITAEWNDVDDSGDAEEVEYFYGTFPTIPTSVDGVSELKVTVNDSQPELENGKYVLRAGQNLKISFKLNSGKMVKSFDGWVEEGTCNKTYSYNSSTGVSSCTYSDFSSDFTVGDLNFTTANSIPASTQPQTGDYYYIDGTWSSTLKSDVACIGIVFKVGTGNGESSFMGLNKINGYVIALNNTSANRLAFAGNTNLVELETGYDKYVGYSIMYQIKKRADFSESAYWACYSVLNYTPAAPVATGGWYLPSLAEFLDLCPNIVTEVSSDGIVETNLKNAGGTKMRGNGGGDGGAYWSISKKNEKDNRPAAYDFGWNSYKPAQERIHTENYSNNSYARPVLAF